MILATFVRSGFQTKPATWQLMFAALLVIGWPSTNAAQRLCEDNSNPVATIRPCTGPVGTAITVSVKRRLNSPVATLAFKRVLANGVPAKISTAIAGGAANAPAQLCAGGSAKWEVWLVLANGQSQGKIGAFWPDCRGTASGNSGRALGGGSAGNSTAGTTPNAPIILPPITMNVDNDVYAKTQGTGQSEIRDITSSDPAVATAREWGTNEIQIHGKKPGVTTIKFFDRASGRYYKVQVTVNGKPKPFGGGEGAGDVAPGKLDPCLIGRWISQSISSPDISMRGGSGTVVAIRADGSVSLDYSRSEPLVFEDGGKQVWKGAASGHISSDHGTLTVNNVETSTVTMENLDPNGRTISSMPFRKSFGEIFSPTAARITYTCGGGTLTIVDVYPRNKETIVLTRK